MPEEDEYEKDLGTNRNKKEKPLYVTRVVAACQVAGLDGEPEPRTAQGVSEHADDFIEFDNNDLVQVDVPVPSMIIKVEVEDIPGVVDTESEPAPEALGPLGGF